MIVLNKVVLFFIMLFAVHIQAQDDKPLIEVKSMVDTSVITIGDRINYTIVIDHKKGLRVERPGEGLNLGYFEIKNYNFHKPEEKNGRIMEQFDFTLSVFDTGRYVIPAFPVAYFLTDTSKNFNLIEASPIDIYVKSVISGDEARELKDIKKPIDIPFNYLYWISLIAAFLIAFVILYLVYWLWKKRKERGYLFSPPPPLVPPHIAAMEALNKLFSSNLLAKGLIKDYFTTLSDIIRLYLEGRYEILALEETTMEIIREIDRLIPEESLRRNLLDILAISDLVKFAKHIPENFEIEKTNSLAVDFIEQTKPVYSLEDGEVPSQSNNGENLQAEFSDKPGKTINEISNKNNKTED